ncbi:MAG TPA: hypothetical protein VHP36_10425 [Chitinispirillaceae bacterium]|nr:hypothetical protein [Chitinispirillaceae bacterium]
MKIPAYLRLLIVINCSSICALAESEAIRDSSLLAETDSTQPSIVNKDELSTDTNDAAGGQLPTVTTDSSEAGYDSSGKIIFENYNKETADNIDTIDGALLTKKIKRIHTRLGMNISKARVQGYGGGIIIQPMLMGFRTKPVHRLAINDSELRHFTFQDLSDHHYQPVLVNGFWLYAGMGNGLRFGFGHWSGESYFRSNITVSDSIMTLKVRTGFDGLMLEKAFIHNNLNFITGGAIGAGSIKVTKSYQESDVFGSVAWDEDLEEGAEAKARMFGLELHAGMTVSLLSWCHIGMDINNQFMLSVNGFGGTANSFVSANPGLRLRLVFGNLG